MKRNLSFLVLFILSTPVLAEEDIQFKARARMGPTYLKLLDSSLKAVAGINPTVNIWFEKRRDYGVGLVFGAFEQPGQNQQTLLLYYGIEGKYFLPDQSLPLFMRAGARAEKLKSPINQIEFTKGAGVHLGIGAEFDRSDLGIAPELAVTYGRIDEVSNHFTISLEIGFHFY